MTGPRDEASRLREGAAELSVSIDERAVHGMLSYLDLLYVWNRSTRLTAIERDEAVRLHLLDCLACVPLLEGCRRLVDLGSGAGLPGLVIALARPELEVHLVEAKRKRCSFLHDAVDRLRLRRCRVVESGAEDLGGGLAGYFDVATARAFRPPIELIRIARPLLARRGKVLVMCGGPGLKSEEADQLGLAARVSERARFRLPGGTERRRIVVVEP